MELIQQIEDYIHEADILSHIIEKSNFMIDKLDGNEDLQSHYIEQILPTVEEYKQTIQALDFLFKEYFEWEAKNNTVKNLRYRRLHKLVIEDLKSIPLTLN